MLNPWIHLKIYLRYFHNYRLIFKPASLLPQLLLKALLNFNSEGNLIRIDSSKQTNLRDFILLIINFDRIKAFSNNFEGRYNGRRIVQCVHFISLSLIHIILIKLEIIIIIFLLFCFRLLPFCLRLGLQFDLNLGLIWILFIFNE